jgi:alginate O-acetyltransferase complex protein AlgI
MLFSSVTFLYYFLPVTLAVYFLTPQPGGSARWRNRVLLAASLVFYAWGEPRYVAVLAAEIGALWGLGLALDRARGGRRRAYLIVSLVAGLGALAVFKYADFFLSNLRALGADVPLLRLALPIGISFYTFQMLSYSIDLYRGKAPVQRNLLDFACYVTLFPQLIAGPIVRYTQVAAQLVTRTHSAARFAAGARRFTVGLAKKVLLANVLGELADLLKTGGDGSVLSAWGYVLAFGLHIYFDFSGYSDMAIGLGTVLGFDFPENFNYPYVARSVTDFWRRWHMTLSGWFRDYVYIPLGGNRVSVPRHLLNIAVVGGLTGFWHGAAWQFMAWGLYFAVLLALEKYVFPVVGRGVRSVGLRRLRPPDPTPRPATPRPLGHVYVLVAVGVSWVFFDADGFAQAGHVVAMMAGAGATGWAGPDTLYYLRSYLVPLLLGVAGATPWPKRAAAWLLDRGRGAMTVLEPATVGVLLVAVTAFLVDGSFNPFIYFRF